MKTSRKFTTSPDILVANATVLVAISSPVVVSAWTPGPGCSKAD